MTVDAKFNTASSLTLDAEAIWQAGVEAVDSFRLVSQQIRSEARILSIAGETWGFTPESRICVVGAGKAGAGMAAAVEEALPKELLQRTTGWVHVPEDCVRNLERIHLHPARPAGRNEPTEAGVAGTRKMLELVSELGPADLCIVLISGGGSALLPAPVPEVTLEDKLAVTRILSRNGADIAELNLVRRNLSEVKGGGLVRRCRAGLIVTLIISDVIGSPLETIASGPTVEIPTDPQNALDILLRYQRTEEPIPQRVLEYLKKQALHPKTPPQSTGPRVINKIIGNNETAVRAASACARSLGYRVVSETWDESGEAVTQGREFAREINSAVAAHPGEKICLIGGGETTVRLATVDGEQLGGRNQEFALSALVEWLSGTAGEVALVSGGTDGEDGPTDAAGARVDSPMLKQVQQKQLDPNPFLRANNSYRFFEQVNGLLKTGPTHTNVMDLRVGLGRSSG